MESNSIIPPPPVFENTRRIYFVTTPSIFKSIYFLFVTKQVKESYF